MQRYSDGDIIARDGVRFRVAIERDEDAPPPWEWYDGHGSVSNWTSREKRPGELILIRDQGSYRYYDFQEAVKIARREGWGGCKGNFPTRRAKAAAAARANYEFLRRWCNDDWEWVWVSVTPFYPDGDENDDLMESCGGVCSDDSDYMVDELIDCALYNINQRLERVIEPWEELGDVPDLSRLAA